MHPTRIFKSPEELEGAWESFKAELKEQAKDWPKVQYVGKEGIKKTDYPIIPYTLEGFKRFCRNNYGEVQHYFDNKEGYYNEFGVICTHIREEIREQQILGGLMGFYNPSITQRLNGLTDKRENSLKGELNIPNLPDIGKR